MPNSLKLLRASMSDVMIQISTSKSRLVNIFKIRSNEILYTPSILLGTSQVDLKTNQHQPYEYTKTTKLYTLN